MALQILLYGIAVHAALGRKVVAPEEEREHRRRRQFAAVAGPDHAREGLAVDLMEDGRAGLVEVAEVHPGGLEGPAGCAIPAGEAAPYVLMGVDKDIEPEG